MAMGMATGIVLLPQAGGPGPPPKPGARVWGPLPGPRDGPPGTGPGPRALGPGPWASALGRRAPGLGGSRGRAGPKTGAGVRAEGPPPARPS